jgi:hypothetical protein
MLEDYAPEIPGYALDIHPMKGKAMGRGLDHFRSEGAKLVPPPTGDDPYIEEASMTQRIPENFFADEDECAEAHQRPPAPVAALLAHSTERYSARS